MEPDSQENRPEFGTRYLTDEALVYEHNAWDHVPPPDDQDEIIQAALDRQRKSPVPDDKKEKYNNRPSLYWDIFYRNNQNNFFKDRKWLQREFPQLEAVAEANAGPKTVFEVGCGAGNVVFPLLSSNKNPHLDIWACDFSKHAVRVVQSNSLYSNPPIGRVHASVWDLSSQTLPEGLKPGTVDVAVMIFVLSALHPKEWAQAIANMYTLLKPGGIIVLRDYGRHDLTQLRFKEGRLLDDNFYIRGDGTRVYFFEAAELGRMFTGSDIKIDEDGPRLRMLKIIQQDESGQSTPDTTAKVQSIDALKDDDQVVVDQQGGEAPEVDLPPPELAASADTSSDTLEPPTPLKKSPLPSQLPPHPLFTVAQLGIDRRLLVNRKKQLKMYRVWLQGEFRKNEPGAEGKAAS